MLCMYHRHRHQHHHLHGNSSPTINFSLSKKNIPFLQYNSLPPYYTCVLNLIYHYFNLHYTFICLLIFTFPIRNAKSVSTGLGLVLFAHCCISRIQTSSWNIISIQIFFPVSSHTKNLGNVFSETSFFSSQTSLLAIQKHKRNTHY